MQRLVLTFCVGVLVIIISAPSSAESVTCVTIAICSTVNAQNSGQNSAVDPGFENCNTSAQTSCESKKRKGSCEPLSAFPVIGWKMHADKSGSNDIAKCDPIKVSAKDDKQMLKVASIGNRSGIFLELSNLRSDARRMLSTWLWTRSGQVAIARQGRYIRPVSWDAKASAEERLRICTNEAASTDSIVINNQGKRGNRFEEKQIAIRDIP
ncbi:hypothetical protein [Nitrosomonas sp. Nm34]|uniref:hypothetical protein n=1 Tax=Nitrosomonas sp. Nm34 TaxID=1881055 RepID=UPI0008EB7633|nr:hypothetical protein [Nitrosomonas sp. Nm34]SFI92503.1 hypothetical protein SAMN05428978_105913 [Nitrosomonas sp. Nm34]